MPLAKNPTAPSSDDRPSPRRRALRRAARLLRRIRIAAAVLAVVALSLGGIVVTQHQAEAATMGSGVHGIQPNGNWLGNMVVNDGRRAYCPDSGLATPLSATTGPVVAGAFTTVAGVALSAVTLQKLNYALDHWGETDDGVLAAAVEAYVYSHTSLKAHEIGEGYAAGAYYINGNAAVLARYDTIWHEAEAAYAQPQGAVPQTGSVAIGPDSERPDRAVLSVRGLASGARIDLTVADAVFTSGGARSLDGVGNGDYPLTIAPPEGGGVYRASVTARAWSQQGYRYDPNVRVYTSAPGQQRLLNHGTVTPYLQQWSLSASETADRQVPFSPVVSTAVPARFLSAETGFGDVLAASLAPGSGQWGVVEGAAAAVTASGVLYGPFSEEPTEAATPPPGAPVFAETTATLSGPGSYPVALSDGLAPPSGFYVWVWTIDVDAQSPAVAALLPAGYLWHDRFGVAAETQVAPAAIVAASHVADELVGLGGGTTDSLDVSLPEGESWPSIGGEHVPLTFTHDLYFLQRGSDALQDGPFEPDPMLPAEALFLRSTEITVTDVGTVTAEPYTAPGAESGVLVSAWSVSRTGPGAGYFRDWNDGFGTEGETTRVIAPRLSTTAQTPVARLDEGHDTAHIIGPLPSFPISVVFAAYERGDDDLAVCTPDTLVFDGSDSPQPVTELGDIDSPEVHFDTLGHYDWVASLIGEDGAVVASEPCGAEGETVLVQEDDLVTHATARLVAGDRGHDTAHVTGLLPEDATLEFAAYRRDGTAATCTAAEQVFSTAEHPVHLRGEGDYRSEPFAFADAGSYDWVATIRNARGVATSSGVCGDPTEVTVVRALPARLAQTGAILRAATPAVGVTAVALGLGALLLARHRRPKHRAQA